MRTGLAHCRLQMITACSTLTVPILEIFVQGDWLLSNYCKLTVFTSTSLMNARYKDAVVKSGNQNIDIDGNKVETAPDVITRNGATFKYRKMSFSVLYSYTSESFAD